MNVLYYFKNVCTHRGSDFIFCFTQLLFWTFVIASVIAPVKKSSNLEINKLSEVKLYTGLKFISRKNISQYWLPEKNDKKSSEGEKCKRKKS